MNNVKRENVREFPILNSWEFSHVANVNIAWQRLFENILFCCFISQSSDRLPPNEFPKSYNLSLDSPPYLVLFKMADKISMNQRYISANTPKSNEPAIYLSQRYIPNNVTNALHFMTGVSLRLGPGNEPKNPCPEWIHRFIWSTMIRVISNHWS